MAAASLKKRGSRGAAPFSPGPLRLLPQQRGYRSHSPLEPLCRVERFLRFTNLEMKRARGARTRIPDLGDDVPPAHHRTLFDEYLRRMRIERVVPLAVR